MENSVIVYRDYGNIVLDIKTIMDKKRDNYKSSSKENRLASFSNKKIL